MSISLPVMTVFYLVPNLTGSLFARVCRFYDHRKSLLDNIRTSDCTPDGLSILNPCFDCEFFIPEEGKIGPHRILVVCIPTRYSARIRYASDMLALGVA